MNQDPVPVESDQRSPWIALAEIAALLTLFFIYAGDPPPAVNEAHYWVKAKNFWDPTFCDQDLFVTSAKAHTTFYWTLGWLTQIASLETSIWIARVVGWLMLAVGLQRCCRAFGLAAFQCLGVAVLWIVGIEYGNFAGEWVVGGIEAKVPAYALVLAGFAAIANRNWSLGWIWLGGASAFHVLTGGWAVIAACIAFVVTERISPDSDQTRARFFSSGLFLGGALSLLGLWPAIRLTLGVSPADSIAAAKIYSYMRIRHHLLPGDFPTWWYVRHGILVVSMLSVLALRRHHDRRQRRVAWIGVGALVIAGCGLIVGLLPPHAPDLAAKLLRYYWFRLSDAVVPLVLALWICQALRTGGNDAQPWPAQRWAAALVLLLSVGLFVASAYQRNHLQIPVSTSHHMLGVHPDADAAKQRQSHADWIAVCDWIKLATPPEEVLLTPRHQQTFKWYAHRAEVVNWKDVPQDAASLIEWERRFEEIYPARLGKVRVTIQYSKLREFRTQYGVRLMVVDNRVTGDHLPLVKLYPTAGQRNATYSVYELPQASK
ncbi:hypothetical protein NHH03_10070 [Stieleria sp. TO1_6]|uniref:DUF6798 domain-containing protein n=1 Tax=Stieleria tagensis TaxID=2956795 RepID=UPI00209B2D03|nr:DUF6798 domain-containing protein [Stieleria tagensis]MCO8122084.1 hypothetical protein [Stieleria tagensis]